MFALGWGVGKEVIQQKRELDLNLGSLPTPTSPALGLLPLAAEELKSPGIAGCPGWKEGGSEGEDVTGSDGDRQGWEGGGQGNFIPVLHLWNFSFGRIAIFYTPSVI